jgi:hypothetical protein
MINRKYIFNEFRRGISRISYENFEGGISRAPDLKKVVLKQVWVIIIEKLTERGKNWVQSVEH